MKAPDRICIRKDDTAPFGFTRHWIYTTKVQEHDIEYIRKDYVDEMLKTAEDGQEKFREELMEWAKFVLKCQEEELAKYDGPSYMRASIMGRIDAYKVLIAKLNSL